MAPVKTAKRIECEAVATAYQTWLRNNPQATRGEKMRAFDRIADRVAKGKRC